MKITSELLKQFRADLTEATKELEKKHGIQLDFGAMTYNDLEFTFKTTASVGGSKQEIERREFEKYANRYEFSNADYRRKVDLNGEEYLLIGFRPRATKRPCIIQSVETGKKYAVNEDSILRQL